MNAPSSLRRTLRGAAQGIAAISVIGLFAVGSGQAQVPGTDATPAPATSSIMRDDQIGVCTHFAFTGDDWPPAKMVPLIVQSGAGWIRDELPWGRMEKVKGVYELPQKTQDWIDAVSAAGVKIDLVLNFKNSLYQDNYDPVAYAQAAAWTARKLADKIQAIEVLNEPENFGYSKYYDGAPYWSGILGDGSVASYVSKYVTLINTAAKAIKAANPAMKVIGLGCSPGANFHALALGLAPEVDGLTDHPYSARSVPELVPFAASPGILKRDGILTADEKGTFASQIRMYRDQSAHYNGPKEIWLTEWGFSTFQEAKAGELGAGFTESAQAKYMLRRLAESLGLGVSVSFIYDLRDDGGDPYNAEHRFGLLDRNSKPKPSYGAVQRYAAAMADFRPKNSFKIDVFPVDSRPDTHPIVWDGGKMATTGNVKTYQFADRKGTALVAFWSTERADGDLNPLLGDLEIETDQTVSKISAYDPLVGSTRDIPFEVQSGRVVLKRIGIPDSPLLLTVTTDLSRPTSTTR